MGGAVATEIVVWDRNAGRLLIDEDKRFRVKDNGEKVGTFETAKEVWDLVSKWAVGRDTIYDGDRFVSREDIKAEMERDRLADI